MDQWVEEGAILSSKLSPMRRQAGWAVGLLLCLSPVLSSGEPIKIAVEFEGESRL